jgi:ElaB/YqjD/DUF883 family membrane-anchored ribosome-binding protein
MTEETQDNIRQSFLSSAKSSLADIEDMLKSSASVSGEKAAELREKMRLALGKAKEGVSSAQGVVADKTKAAARATDDYVHDHPWQAVGVGAALGFVLGLLLNRK